MIRLGKKEGWGISLTGFNPEDAGLTPDQAVLFDQILAWEGIQEKGKKVINFILIYNGTEELTLTEFANTPIGTEIRTPNIAGVHSYYHKKKSHNASVEDWGKILKDRPYRVYTAYLLDEQLVMNATVLENTLGFDIHYVNQNELDIYRIFDLSSENGFKLGDEEKVMIFITQNNSAFYRTAGISNKFDEDDGYMELRIASMKLSDGSYQTDGSFQGAYLEIRVYS